MNVCVVFMVHWHYAKLSKVVNFSFHLHVKTLGWKCVVKNGLHFRLEYQFTMYVII